jgi:hypothetical protein
MRRLLLIYLVLFFSTSVFVVATNSTCIDSDGDDYFTKGNVTFYFNGTVNLYFDYCNGDIIFERRCSHGKYLSHMTYSCSWLGNYYCDDGACVESEILVGNVTDISGFDNQDSGTIELTFETTDNVDRIVYYIYDEDNIISFGNITTIPFKATWESDQVYQAIWVKAYPYFGEFKGNELIVGPYSYLGNSTDDDPSDNNTDVDNTTGDDFSDPVINATCYDSDGLDYDTLGHVFGTKDDGTNFTFDDYCDGDLIEYYCDGIYYSHVSYNCEYFCRDGKCIDDKNGDNEVRIEFDVETYTPVVMEPIDLKLTISNYAKDSNVYYRYFVNSKQIFKSSNFNLNEDEQKEIIISHEFSEPGVSDFKFELVVVDGEDIEIYKRFFVKNRTSDIICNSDLDCPGRYYGNFECNEKTIFRSLFDFSCENAGTKESSCQLIETKESIRMCKDNEYCIDGYPACLVNNSYSPATTMTREVVVYEKSSIDLSWVKKTLMYSFFSFLGLLIIILLILYITNKTKKSKVTSHKKDLLKPLPEKQKLIINTLLKNKGDLTQNKLKVLTGLPKSTLSRNLRFLETGNFIERVDLGNVKRVKLTEWFKNK